MISINYPLNRNSYKALAVIVSALVGFILIQVGNPIPGLQVILGMLYAFFLPGYALTLVIFKAKQKLLDRVLISMGLSLIVDILIGFILNATPLGLNIFSWTLALSCAVFLSGLMALALSYFYPPEREVHEEPKFNWSGWRVNPGHIFLYALSGAVIIAALVLARNGAAQQPYTGFTQLWLLPEVDQQQTAVRLGLINGEQKTLDYTLQLKINNQVISQWDISAIKPGERWETITKLPPHLTAKDTVEAVLYLKSQPGKVYRWAKFTGNGN